MSRTVIAWLIVLPWALWAVARVLGLERGYPFVQLMAYTPYVVPLALVAGGLAALLRRWAPATVAAATVVVLAALLAPRALGDDSPADGPELRVMTANAYRGPSGSGSATSRSTILPRAARSSPAWASPASRGQTTAPSSRP